MTISMNLLPEDKRGACPKDYTFGRNFSDHMFQQTYRPDGGWSGAEIKPLEPIALHPAASIFHYGQEVFEGMKAYRRKDGGINMFRPDANAARFNRSAARMMMPQVDADFHVEALKALLTADQAWIPDERGSSLYIRPTMIATSAQLGLGASGEYIHFIITGPAGAYFTTGFNPVSVFVSETARRAVKGGVGEAKTGGNYAASLMVSEQAAKEGFNQVLWLDAIEGRYIEEVGAMNICFVKKDGTILTPELSGSILPGITRDSVIKLAPTMGHEVIEGRLDIQEILGQIRAGDIVEVFGCGTAAVIAPVGSFSYGGEDYVINGGQSGLVSNRLFDALVDLQYGNAEDPFGWVVPVT